MNYYSTKTPHELTTEIWQETAVLRRHTIMRPEEKHTNHPTSKYLRTVRFLKSVYPFNWLYYSCHNLEVLIPFPTHFVPTRYRILRYFSLNDSSSRFVGPEVNIQPKCPFPFKTVTTSAVVVWLATLSLIFCLLLQISIWRLTPWRRLSCFFSVLQIGLRIIPQIRHLALQARVWSQVTPYGNCRAVICTGRGFSQST